MPVGGTGRAWSVLTLLFAYGLLAFVPILVIGGYLLFRLAHAERLQLEERVHQIAEAVAGDVERELQRRITVLETLATSPRIWQGDFAGFHGQARAAVGKDDLVILLHDAVTRQQLVNTFVEFGAPLPTTGDPETFARVLQGKRLEISDVFMSLVSKTFAIDIASPLVRSGKVRYLLKLSLSPDHFRQILAGQTLDRRWTLTIVDRRGVIVARSENHPISAGTPLPARHLNEISSPKKAYESKSIDGQAVIAANASIPSAGWHVRVSAPLEVAQASGNHSTMLLTAVALSAALVTMVLGALFASMISRPLWTAAKMAEALGRQETLVGARGSYREADAVAEAMQNASRELAKLRVRERLVVRESSHRVKNILAVVQSLAQRSLSDERPSNAARTIFLERLHALGRAHDMLILADWEGAPLAEIVAAELKPYGGRVRIEGPPLMIGGRLTQTFSLLLHELATNAVKYGALSNDDGTVTVTWRTEDDEGTRRFKFRWKESGGPMVTPPSTRGFGSTLLQAAMPTDANTPPRIGFEEDGFVYELDMPLSALGNEASDEGVETEA